MDVCLLAGKIMLQNGAETYRVEDTMTRIAAAFGMKDSHSYVTPTGIIFSIDGAVPVKFARILERSTNLHKVVAVNAISRRISSGELSFEEAGLSLRKVECAAMTYGVPLQIAAAALASACFLMMFKGSWPDFLPAFMAGGAGFTCSIYVHRFVPIKFFAELLSSFIIGLIAFLFVQVGLGQEVDKIIIGSVMPLVPGLLITNAVRDLMAGHLVSGLSKGAEAFLTASAIGTGIAMVFSFQ
ncbi:MAG: threonine/serine exporter family protein [Gorillibacterium sp.]|nr:threonine/serine exporter family protein [Gorillibacterium sp.]